MASDSPSPPPAEGKPPASPKVVKATPKIQTPREILLEKKLSRLEDDVSGLKSWQDEINSFLADVFQDEKTASKSSRKLLSTPKTEPPPPDNGTFLDGLAKEFGLED